MVDEQLEDLKQFIAGVVSQSETSLRRDLATKNQLQALRTEVNDGFKGIGDAIDAFGEHLDKRFEIADHQLQDHEKRITRLEGHDAA